MPQLTRMKARQASSPREMSAGQRSEMGLLADKK